jgi:hypothetical protein
MEASRQKSRQASHFLIRIAPCGFAALLLFGGAACATCSEPSPPSLSAQVRNADAAYQSLPASLAAYNLTVRELCGAMEVQTPSQFASNLKKLGVSFDSPKVGLPLRHVEVPTSQLRFTRQRVFSWMLPRSMTGLPAGRDSRFGTGQAR